MFLEQTLARNSALVDYAFFAHQKGLLPDSYLIDLDTLRENAALISKSAAENNISLYFMLKQLGRNPMLAKELCALGYTGAVAVDFNEALFYIRHQIPLGHAGHLVQPPFAAVKAIVAARPQIITVYSAAMARQINAAAQALGFVQPVMVRILEKQDFHYSGQLAGFHLSQLEEASREMAALTHIRLEGVCSFPCFQYNAVTQAIEPTSNAFSVQKAVQLLQGLGHTITQVNLPSTSCAASMPLVAAMGGTHAEPGHGLTGTTPYHMKGLDEKPAILYLTETSHNYEGQGYCYGGGYYRRGHLQHALVGGCSGTRTKCAVCPPDDDSIDYHIGLEKEFEVGQGIVMAFRTQIFVTRSHVAIVEGLATGNPRIVGLYDALGNQLES